MKKSYSKNIKINSWLYNYFEWLIFGFWLLESKKDKHLQQRFFKLESCIDFDDDYFTIINFSLGRFFGFNLALNLSEVFCKRFPKSRKNGYRYTTLIRYDSISKDLTLKLFHREDFLSESNKGFHWVLNLEDLIKGKVISTTIYDENEYEVKRKLIFNDGLEKDVTFRIKEERYTVERTRWKNKSLIRKTLTCNENFAVMSSENLGEVSIYIDKYYKKFTNAEITNEEFINSLTDVLKDKVLILNKER